MISKEAFIKHQKENSDWWGIRKTKAAKNVVKQTRGSIESYGWADELITTRYFRSRESRNKEMALLSKSKNISYFLLKFH